MNRFDMLKLYSILDQEETRKRKNKDLALMIS